MKELFREHPSLALTLCYLLATAVGVVYSYFFYNEFGINIVKFVDLSDFLLASIQEPTTLVIFFGVGLFTFTMFQFDFLMRRRWPGYARWLEKQPGAKYIDRVVFTTVIIIFVFWGVMDFAIEEAEQIKGGTIDEYAVSFSDSPAPTAGRSLALLGNTSRFTYLYDVESTEVLIVPVENIALLRK